MSQRACGLAIARLASGAKRPARRADRRSTRDQQPGRRCARLLAAHVGRLQLHHERRNVDARGAVDAALVAVEAGVGDRRGPPRRRASGGSTPPESTAASEVGLRPGRRFLRGHPRGSAGTSAVAGARRAAAPQPLQASTSPASRAGRPRRAPAARRRRPPLAGPAGRRGRSSGGAKRVLRRRASAGHGDPAGIEDALRIEEPLHRGEHAAELREEAARKTRVRERPSPCSPPIVPPRATTSA